MKKVIISMLLLLFISPVFADNFQLLYREGGASYAVAYSHYAIVDSNGKQMSEGYSDKYGRIIVNLGRGNYVCEVVYKNVIYRKTITVDGNTTIRELQLQ